MNKNIWIVIYYYFNYLAKNESIFELNSKDLN